MMPIVTRAKRNLARKAKRRKILRNCHKSCDNSDSDADEEATSNENSESEAEIDEDANEDANEDASIHDEEDEDLADDVVAGGQDLAANIANENVPPHLRFLLDSDSSDDDESEDELNADLPASARQVNMNIPHPNTSADWEANTPNEKLTKVIAWKNLVHAARQRLRRRLASADLVEDSHERAPRLFSALHVLGAGGIVNSGMEFECRADARIAILELCEVTHNIPLWKGKGNHELKAVTEGPCQPNQQHLRVCISRSSKFCTWRVKGTVLIPSQGISANLSKKSSAYGAKDLAPIILEIARAGTPGMLKGALLSAQLNLYSCRPVSSSLMYKTKTEAYLRLYGEEGSNMRYLPALVHDLKEAGHKAQLETMNGEEMCKAVMDIRKQEHSFAETEKAKRLARLPAAAPMEQRAALLPVSWVTAKRGIMQEEAQYFSGLKDPEGDIVKSYFSRVHFIPRTALIAGDKISRVITMDACVGKGMGSKYSHFYVVGLSANKNLIPLCLSIIVGNESNATWGAVLEFAKRHLPYLNRANLKFTAIVDNDKGMENAIPSVFENLNRFLCVQHRGANVLRNSNAVGKVWYDKCVRANTVRTLDSYSNAVDQHWSQLSHVSKAYLGRYAAWMQFPAAAAARGVETLGKTASQGVESLNNANLQARNMDPFNALLWIAEREVKRFQEHRVMALRATDKGSIIVRHASKHIANLKLQGLQVSLGAVENHFSVKHDADTFQVVLLHFDATRGEDNCGSCSCGRPVITRLPCKHMLAAANARGRDAISLVPKIYTVERWLGQYGGGGEIDVPFPDSSGLREVAREDKSIRAPVVGAPKKGRPRIARIRSCFEKASNICHKRLFNGGLVDA